LVVSIDHNLLSYRHSLVRVAPSSSPRVIVSNVGPSEYVGLRLRSMPPSGLKLVAYNVSSADNFNCLSLLPAGLSMFSHSVSVPMMKR